MGRSDKLLESASRNPDNLSFRDFESLLIAEGWVLRRQSGSHRLWYSPGGYRLSVQPTKDNNAKGYQVRQFLAQREKEQ